MNKFLVVGLLLLAIPGLSQKEILFKNETLPKKVYRTSSRTTSEMEMNVTGSEEQINSIKAKMKLPVVGRNVEENAYVVKTGKKKGNSIPFEVKYEKSHSEFTLDQKTTTNDKPYVGAVIRGRSIDGKIEIDTIIGNGLDDMSRAFLKQAMTFQNTVSFPTAPMKIGDSFEQMVPMEFPISGMEPIKLNMAMTYTLKEITDTLGKFDVSLAVTLDWSKDGVRANVTGTGDGTLDYDLKMKTMTRLENDLNIKMDIRTTENLDMIGAINAKSLWLTQVQ